MTKHTLTFVSHTHWDREWYQPFEEYRIRLVQLVDKLLHILDTDPDYKYFMLDGQTIVLGDYLAIRPENEAKLKSYVQSGRLLIGPWYILPDEFLVAPESTIRNLLVGAEVCADFGKRMDVGNIPDPFGHISQLPQILRGFDIDSMVFWRGVSGVKNEFVWTAPDGTDVLVIHQHIGYGNAANMPAKENLFIARTKQIMDRLAPTATTPHLLAMNGSDHVEPMPELPRLLAAAAAALPEVAVRHGTLPQFIADVRAAAPELNTHSGEMRDSSAAPLLPGVLSARMWIKQRNAACETLLTHWAEPLTALAEIAGAPLSLHKQSALVKQAWRYLLQNHPHDSICGCSVDQVHKEMDVRFDWVEQIGEKVTEQCLEALAAVVDTDNKEGNTAIVVFNPTTRPRTDVVDMQVVIPQDAEDIVLVSSDGETVVPSLGERKRDVLWEFMTGVQRFMAMAGREPILEINGQGVQAFVPAVEGNVLHLEIRVARGLPPNEANVKQGRAEVERILAKGEVERVHLVVHRGEMAHCVFVARDVPGLGYRTYEVRVAQQPPVEVEKPDAPAIENAFFKVQVKEDGTFALTDKETGTVYCGLNRFVDVGDRGDEYNFCPVEEDVVVSAPAGEPLVCLTEYGPTRQTLEVSMTYQIPVSLGETRGQRSKDRVDLPITTRISLVEGVRRVEVETTVQNEAADHRLRAHFPVPVQVDAFDAEGHFDVISRALDLPTDTEEWVEQPAPTHPQRTWSDVSDGETGLLVANRGLPEIEVLRTAEGSEVALTLLRSVGWLSRADMSVRRGHAGPGLPTPEAQCIGEYTFHYALVPHRGGWQQVFDQAYAFNASFRAVVTYAHDGSLPIDGSFVQVESPHFVVSTVKEAEKGSGLIVRLWNTHPMPSQGTVRLALHPKRVVRCNLGERELEALDVGEDGTVTVAARGREIVTLLAEFD